MERMTTHTAGRWADAAGARLRALAVSYGLVPNPLVPCPISMSSNGTVKQGITGGFGTTDHSARRHPERSP
jgi:hypothetical protein